MSRTWKHIVAACAAVAVTVPLAACGGGSDDGAAASLPDAPYKVSADTPAWQIDDREDNTLTWYVNADWWNKSWGDDLVTKRIAEDLNLDVEFTIGDDTKLNTYFASGDLPDIITVLDVNSQVVKNASQWAWPLEDLADKYDPYFNEVASGDTLEWYRMDDGKTYGYPSYSNTQADYDSGMIKPTTAFVVRRDVLAAIGDQDFTTPEGFLKGMKAIKEKFPDLIPFGFNDFSGGNSSLDNVLQDMLGVPIVTDDGKFYDRRLDDDYLTWLDTLRQLHADGGISDDSFADDGDAFKEKITSGKYATMLMANTVNMSAPLQAYASAHPDEQYTAVDGMFSTKGNAPTLSQSGLSGWTISFISKDCKNPSKAIQAFEYLLSDYGQMLVNFGVEGETYTKNDDGTVSWTEAADEVRLNDPTRWQQEYRIGEFVLFGHDRYKALSKDSFTPAIWQMQEWGQGYLVPQFKIENITPDTGTPENRAYTAINTKWTTTMTSLIRAASEDEFAKILDEYRRFLEGNDNDGVTEIRNEKIARNLDKLEAMGR